MGMPSRDRRRLDCLKISRTFDFMQIHLLRTLFLRRIAIFMWNYACATELRVLTPLAVLLSLQLPKDASIAFPAVYDWTAIAIEANKSTLATSPFCRNVSGYLDSLSAVPQVRAQALGRPSR